jgi:hypothetical protein
MLFFYLFLIVSSQVLLTRILFEDTKLFLNVGWFENYSAKFMEEIWPSYLKDVLGASSKEASEILANTDKSIYVSTTKFLFCIILITLLYCIVLYFCLNVFVVFCYFHYLNYHIVFYYCILLFIR